MTALACVRELVPHAGFESHTPLVPGRDDATQHLLIVTRPSEFAKFGDYEHRIAVGGRGITVHDVEVIAEAVHCAAVLTPAIVHLPTITRLASQMQVLQALEDICRQTGVQCRWVAHPHFTHDQVMAYCRINYATISTSRRRGKTRNYSNAAVARRQAMAMRTSAALIELRSVLQMLQPQSSKWAAYTAIAAEFNSRGVPTIRPTSRIRVWTPDTVKCVCQHGSLNPLQPQPTILQVHDTIARLQHHQHRTADHQPNGTGDQVHS